MAVTGRPQSQKSPPPSLQLVIDKLRNSARRRFIDYVGMLTLSCVLECSGYNCTSIQILLAVHVRLFLLSDVICCVVSIVIGTFFSLI